MIRNIAIAGGAMLLGSVCFVGGLWVHFPDDALITRLQYELQERGGGGWALEAEGARPWFPAGVTLTDVTLFEVQSPKPKPKRRRVKNAEDEDPAEDAAKKAVPFMRAATASVRLALLPMLLGKQQVDFAADVYGGDLSGSIATGGERRAVSIEGEDLDLSLVPISGDDWEIDATGLLNIDVDVDLSEAKGRSAEHSGSVTLRFDKLALPRISVSGMDMMPVTFSEAGLTLELKGNKAEITQGRFEGDVVDATFTGNITLGSLEPSRWRMRVEIAVELDEKLGQMANMLPNLRGAKDENGVYHFLCTGSVSSPVCREDRSKGKGGGGIGAGPGPRNRPGPGEDGPPGLGGDVNRRIDKGMDDGPNIEVDPDAEARRQARKDRIKERRERLRQQREGAGPEGDVREFEEGPEPMDRGGPMDGEEQGPPFENEGGEDPDLEIEPDPEMMNE
jgi:type II secretion system protein N